MAIITIGKGQQYSNPYYAAPHVQSGDVVEIFPGTYGGAWFWSSNITIVGMGPGVVIAGPQLTQGKGLFVLSGTNVTVKNITFKDATNYDGNGAGINFTGTNLTVLDSTFINNQDGILTAPNKNSTITVKNSTFDGNGSTAGAHGAAHAIYAGAAALLDVENSTFINTQQGHSIKSRANNTIIKNNSITDGPNGTSSYLIDLPNGGAATITGNYLEKGPRSSNYSYAITMGEEGATNPAGPIIIANNTYVNDDRPGIFVNNQTGNSNLSLTATTISGQKTTVLNGRGTIAGTVVTSVAPLPAAPRAPHPRDFNGDGKSDILVTASDGSGARIYTMNGLSSTSSASVAAPAGSGWVVVASGDLNGDGKADLVWQNASTQSIVLNEMNGSSVVASGTLNPGAGWKVVGQGDFNADGKSDLVLQNGSSVEILLMNGLQIAGSSVVGTAPAGCRYVASGDFNGDGKADILWQDPSTRQLQIWTMNGATRTGSSVVNCIPGAGWTALDTGDFNADGKTDILWQNTITGQAAVWTMGGMQFGSGGALSTQVAAGWKVAGSGDYNGDGKSDILFRNTSTGAMGIWTMSGTSYLGGSTSIGVNPGTGFAAVTG
jgi:hypothetical protein